MGSELPSRVVAGISFVGRGGWQVKALSGFKKSHHTVPDAVNAATQAFFAKLCATEIAAEAEKLFQAVRPALNYKRADLSLTVSSPNAVLTAKDFVVEWLYGLNADDPTRFDTTLTLHSLRRIEVARTPAFEGIFARKFSELSFVFREGARVETVIDAIEAADESALSVSYPSDYSECEIAVAGVDARVRCTSGSIDLLFPQPASPAELIDGFMAVRSAFALSKELAGLVA